MKRLLFWALLSCLFFTVWAVEDNNPCKHPKLGKCDIELEAAITAHATLEPLEGGAQTGGSGGSGLSQYKPISIAPIVLGKTNVIQKESITLLTTVSPSERMLR